MEEVGVTPSGELDASKLDVGDGMFTIIGVGSLLSENSARRTIPELKNFRVGHLHGWRRVFAHAAPIFHKVGVAIWETMEMGSLSVEPVNQGWNCANAMPVTLFESPSTPESRKAFVEREHEFRFVKVYPEAEERPAVLCCKGSNQLVRGRCGTEAEFRERYGQYGLEQVWRKDVLPCRPYLRHCVLAAEKLGIKEEFLASTFLSDGETSLHAYLEQNPSIMSEEPPVGLEDRYGG